MQIHPSVFDAGYSSSVVYTAIEDALVTTHVGNDPTRLLVLGRDENGNLLELITVVRREDILVVFVAPAREEYLPLVVEAEQLFNEWTAISELDHTTTHATSIDGLQLTDPLIHTLFEQAERGYDVDRLMTRTRPGRPAPLTLGGVIRVGLDAELTAAVQTRVREFGEDEAELLVDALREYVSEANGG